MLNSNIVGSALVWMVSRFSSLGSGSVGLGDSFVCNCLRLQRTVLLRHVMDTAVSRSMLKMVAAKAKEIRDASWMQQLSRAFLRRKIEGFTKFSVRFLPAEADVTSQDLLKFYLSLFVERQRKKGRICASQLMLIVTCRC
jgi:hypothetical protein